MVGHELDTSKEVIKDTDVKLPGPTGQNTHH